MRNLWKIILLNLGLIIASVVIYSKGLLGLHWTGTSILLDGLSVIVGLGLGAGLIFGNAALLREPKRRQVAELNDPNKALALIKEHNHSNYFGSLAKSVADQASRAESAEKRADFAVKSKFQAGSMTQTRYSAAVAAAGDSIRDNIANIAARFQIFDDREYARLKSYRHDSIPDDIQEKQLELYARNMDQIKQMLSDNEHMILQLDTLALEISDSNERNQGDAEELINEINRLSGELKYYS
ncbi:MAG: hypothetical protein K6C36_04655 [Clostridia bacterium]|nr:hypothetical protein [Clostridia bacterium]